MSNEIYAQSFNQCNKQRTTNRYTVFVSGLKYQTKEDDIIDIFINCGKIE